MTIRNEEHGAQSNRIRRTTHPTRRDILGSLAIAVTTANMGCSAMAKDEGAPAQEKSPKAAKKPTKTKASKKAAAGKKQPEKTPAKQKTPGPSEQIRVALVGCGGMGRYNLSDFLRCPAVHCVAVCDVDAKHMDETEKEVGRKREGMKPDKIKDYRAVLDRKDVDVVICGTPDHWHGLVGVHSCQAGKDLYCEKPLTHNIKEGRAMVDAARKHKRVVQVGTQQRSGEHFQEAVEIVRTGRLGKITSCKTWNYGNIAPEGVGFKKDCAPPAHVDYDMWLGPAPKRPFNPNRFHYEFRWFFDYAGGKVTDWGVHLIDIVLWAMQVHHPRSVVAMGGKYCLRDNRDTPDTIDVIYDFVDFTLTYSHRACNGRKVNGRHYGISFHGTNGTLAVDRNGYTLYPETEKKAGVEVPKIPPKTRGKTDQHWPHVQNFIECLKTRKRPIADIEDIHHSTTVCNLGNIAYKVGRQIYWDGAKEQIIGDEAANRLTGREMRKPYTL